MERVLFRRSKLFARAALPAGAAVALALLSSGPAAAQTTLTAPTIDTADCVSGLCRGPNNAYGQIVLTFSNPNSGASSRVRVVRIAPPTTTPPATPPAASHATVVFDGLVTSPFTYGNVAPLLPDEVYAAYVRAEQSGSTSSSWAVTPSGLRMRLGEVTGLQLVPSVHGFSATWNDVAVVRTTLSTVTYTFTYECSPSARVTVPGLSVKSYRVTGLVAGRPCSVGVRAISATTGRPLSPELTVVPVGPTPPRVTGVSVTPLDGGLRVSWSAAGGPVSQYRVHAEDASGRFRRAYTDPNVLEAVVDGLANGVEYTVTVRALATAGGTDGPESEPRASTPVDAGETDGGGDPDGEAPVPALPLAGAGVLAGLLAAAGAYRQRRASAARRAESSR